MPSITYIPVRRASYVRRAAAPARWLYPLLVTAGRCFFQYVLAGAVLAVVVLIFWIVFLATLDAAEYESMQVGPRATVNHARPLQ